jgi:diguanylate cyclase (GGDEF)-like protein
MSLDAREHASAIEVDSQSAECDPKVAIEHSEMGEPLHRAALWNDDRKLRRFIWGAYGVLGAILAAYFASLIIRRTGQTWTWLDGWLVCALEGVAAVLCIAHGLTSTARRAISLTLGVALLAWSIGDLFLTIQTIGGSDVPVPSLADLFYIGFYPLAYVAIVLIIRQMAGRLTRPNWLDGLVAGLGAAAICAAFAFNSIAQISDGGAVAAMTRLAYPVGDLLLLSLVIGGSAVMAGRRTIPWILLAAGISLNVVGDTFNLFQASEYATRIGADLNAIAWPTSILLISMSVWVRPTGRGLVSAEKTAGFVVPGIAAGGALVVLGVGSMHSISWVALGLAFATLLLAAIRMAVFSHALRVVTEDRHRQAHTDELTGLGNRRHLFDVLDASLGQQRDLSSQSSQLAFLFVDLDHFKEINDSFGHAAGDEVLKQLGPRLARAVPAGSPVMRLGGDEFAIVLLDASASDALRIAEGIITELKEPFELRKFNAAVGASIGIALAPSDARDSNDLLWCADVAMYRAKSGSTGIAYYDLALDGDDSKLLLVDDLHDAIVRGDFVLHYQPQLDFRTGEIRSVEALIRWHHPRLGLVPPLKFLPLVEESNLMTQLTEWVLNEALEQCASWRKTGQDLVVAVNVSASNLLDPGLADLIQSLLEVHAVPPEALVIEVTETSIITEFKRSQAVISTLRDRGITVSIDDFGSGFTSLAYLSTLAVGELKLDQSFLAGLNGENRDRDIELIRATIQLGHDMGLRVVAEGIEDAATLELVKDLGCDLGQGFFICRPIPPTGIALQSVKSPLATMA